MGFNSAFKGLTNCGICLFSITWLGALYLIVARKSTVIFKASEIDVKTDASFYMRIMLTIQRNLKKKTGCCSVLFPRKLLKMYTADGFSFHKAKTTVQHICLALWSSEQTENPTYGPNFFSFEHLQIKTLIFHLRFLFTSAAFLGKFSTTEIIYLAHMSNRNKKQYI